MRRLAGATSGLLVFVLATSANAEEQERAFNPTIEYRPTEFPAETGFIPSSGPLKVNLKVAAYQEVLIANQGVGRYDFDNLTLEFEGTTDTGIFNNTLGAEVIACIAVDALGIQQEFEVGVWDITEEANGIFTPYLLPGAPDRPISIAETIGPFNLVDQAPFDFGIVTGWISIDYQFDVPGISYQGTHIETDTLPAQGGADIASHDQEGQVVGAILPNVDANQQSTIWSTMYGEFSSEIALRLMPTVHVELFGSEFDIGPLDFPIDYDVIENEEIIFEPLQLVYDVPETPEGTTGGVDETGADTNDDGGNEQGATTGNDESTSGSNDDGSGGAGSGIPSDGFGEPDPGCGCRGQTSDPLWALVLFPLLAGSRRRRRSSLSL